MCSIRRCAVNAAEIIPAEWLKYLGKKVCAVNAVET